MSDRYLVALAFHSDNPGDLSPSQASIAQFENALSVRYDGAIRQALAGQHLDPAELRYISVLAVLSAGQTVAAQVKDACRFFLAVDPQVPPSGSSAFVARETLAMVAADGAASGRAVMRGAPTGRRKGAKKRATTKPSTRKTAARKTATRKTAARKTTGRKGTSR